MPSKTKKNTARRSSISPQLPVSSMVTPVTPSNSVQPASKPPSAKQSAPELSSQSMWTYSERETKMLDVVEYRIREADSLQLVGLVLEVLQFCGVRDPSAMLGNLRTYGDKLKAGLIQDGRLTEPARDMVSWYARTTQLDSESVTIVVARIHAIGLLVQMTLAPRQA